MPKPKMILWIAGISIVAQMALERYKAQKG